MPRRPNAARRWVTAASWPVGVTLTSWDYMWRSTPLHCSEALEKSWARSADRLSNVLYHHLRMAKEVQLHMWISFLEGVVSLSGGRMTGGIEIDTRRVHPPSR
jgi:hypothetical protein